MSRNAPLRISKLLDPETQDRLRIMNEAARAAVAENRAHGLPEIHWIDGQVVYEMPDGSRTTEVPECLKGKGADF